MFQLPKKQRNMAKLNKGAEHAGFKIYTSSIKLREVKDSHLRGHLAHRG